MNIIGIDPGPKESAVVAWDCEIDQILYKFKKENAYVREWLSCATLSDFRVGIEMIQSFGMSVGQTVFETCMEIGRFYEVWKYSHGVDPHLIYRKDIKLHFCQSTRAKDANIRQALIDRFGPPGTKKAPGLTYGLAADLWSAFAVAVFLGDCLEGK